MLWRLTAVLKEAIPTSNSRLPSLLEGWLDVYFSPVSSENKPNMPTARSYWIVYDIAVCALFLSFKADERMCSYASFRIRLLLSPVDVISGASRFSAFILVLSTGTPLDPSVNRSLLYDVWKKRTKHTIPISISMSESTTCIKTRFAPYERYVHT